ncbi:MAG: HAMP domain-containing protein, partial [Betaproteobacteria bacterium]|nr:HAMP domain-containing protein [Betaproteobacteria bacterium]
MTLPGLALLPRTLLRHTFLLLAALMLLSVLAWFQIYAHYETRPRAHQSAQLVASVINLTRVALVSADPARRRDLLWELSDREGIRIYPAEDDEQITPLPDEPLYRLIAEEVRQLLGDDTRLADQRNGLEGFWASFRIDDDDYWVVLPRERLEGTLPGQWIGWGSVALLMALAGAYFIVARVTRPLRALAGAANAIGRGERPPPIEEGGPEEIAAVARTFNQMSRDLAALEADRALVLAGVSHDLRTPLARLRLGVEMGGTDPSLREGMEADIEDMDRTIGQFLDFARETSGEPLAAVEPASLVAALCEQYARRGLRIDTDLQPMPAQMLRPRAVTRMLANLAENALRYAGAAAPIGLLLYQRGGNAVFEVADRGPGIPPDQAERLKRPFTRLEAARSGASSAGLGLAIA